MKAALIVFIYNLVLLGYVVGALFLLRRTRSARRGRIFLFLPVILSAVGVISACVSPVDVFAQIQLIAWMIFVHQPLLVLGGAYLLLRESRTIALTGIVTAVAVLLTGCWSFFVEPTWLEVAHLTIPSGKVKAPVRAALVADLQTDNPGPYEERVLQTVKEQKADLILLAGDYLQTSNYRNYRGIIGVLNKILREIQLEAPLGVYAVQGNVDWPGLWPQIFADVPITVIEKSATLDLGPVVLTALSYGDSTNTGLVVGPQEKFHIVLGHAPDFSIGQVQGDLLMAGHTHGGQVPIPFFGPIITFSEVPRSWASGMTYLGPEKTLIVSRGIGMERGNAPRMRFLCRPEIVIVDIAPAK